jgi:predicted transcriptional regulator
MSITIRITPSLPPNTRVKPTAVFYRVRMRASDRHGLRASRWADKRNHMATIEWIVMKSGLTRERMIEAIRDLPADASVDDAIERLVFLAKIEEGLAQLDRGEGIPHDEVKRRLGL